MATPMSLSGVVRRAAVSAEQAWDARNLRRGGGSPRFEPYLGHGTTLRAVVRGRLLLGPAPEQATLGEHPITALRRSLVAFSTTEVPREQLEVRLGRAQVSAQTDDEGYLVAELRPGLRSTGPGWRTGAVLVDGVETPVHVRVPSASAGFGVISDLDDTIVQTGVDRPLTMLHRTLTGSALTRRTFPDAPELYRALAAGPQGTDQHPFFYVSSSPWNLHGFLVSFLDHRGFPRGPLLLRDLMGNRRRRDRVELKRRAIGEILDLHGTLSFVLIGDSGEADVQLYAEVVREHPGRVLAVYIHEVRGTPGAGEVQDAIDGWESGVPLVVARSFREMSRHAAGLGLLWGGADGTSG